VLPGGARIEKQIIEVLFQAGFNREFERVLIGGIKKRKR
jgi:hypothetical protein